jgi:hypothetical protein
MAWRRGLAGPSSMSKEREGAKAPGRAGRICWHTGERQARDDAELQGAKRRCQRASITVKPCNVVGGVVTTVLYFFQHPNQGRNLIQGAANKYLVQDVTNIINSQLP